MSIQVDEQDRHLLEAYPWRPTKIHNTSYAAAKIGGRTRYLHRMIMGEPPGKEIHHKDANGLNCRRENLEICSHVKNLAQQRRVRANAVGFQGVSKNGNGYLARTKVMGRDVYLGTFRTPEQAHEAYKAFVSTRLESLS